MSLPAGVLTRPVRLAAPVTHAGDTLTVRVTIEPSHTIVHAASGTALANIVTDNSAEPGTGLLIDVPVTDQAGFIDTAGNSFTGWSYTARIELLDTLGKSRHLVKKFSIPAALADVDLMMVPSGTPAAPVAAEIPLVSSIAALAGIFTAWAADPERLFTGTVTRDAGGAATAAAVLWPDGITGTYAGTASATFAGAVDSYTITHGTTTYTQPAVTRDAAGNITNQPAITVTEEP